MEDRIRNKHLFEMSGDEFMQLFKYSLGLVVHGDQDCETLDKSKRVEKHYLHGLKELAEFLGCTPQTACNIKNSGVIDEAVAQIGNHIIVDRDLCFDLLRVKKHVTKMSRKKAH